MTTAQIPVLTRSSGRIKRDADTAAARTLVRSCPLCDRDDTSLAQQSSPFTRCCECGLYYRSTMPAADEVAYWTAYVGDAQEQSYDGRRQPFFRAYWKLLARLSRAHASTPSILDVGGVPGQLLREACDSGWDAHGVELSEPLCDLMRANCDATLWQGHVEDIDFGNQRFDLIVISNAFRHFTQPMDALRKCATLLRSGGSLVIREMNADSSRYNERLAKPYPLDMQFVTPATARRFLARAGFTQVRTMNSPMSMLTIRTCRRLAHRLPGALRAAVAMVNAGVRVVDPVTARCGRPLTPLFLSIGRRC